ncbi:SURF1 family cytochrome oxidase biogenesis protein [Planococcus sp. APC 4015]|nr:SURF1 family cytochrome oxidase biogenesis protein [Planococcus sp. APC 4015]
MTGPDPEPGPSASSGPGTPVAEPVEAFPPTLREVMLRPQWIGMLVLCLVVAGVFAWLGQWQLSRAIDTNPPPAGATEIVRPLADVVEPGEYLSDPLVGQRVEVTGSWVPGDFIVVASRFNDGVEGYWVTGQLRVADILQPTSLAVAIGWAATAEEAADTVAQLDELDASPVTLTGRIISDEGPVPPRDDVDPLMMTRMSPAALLSMWHDTEGLDVYRQYLASQTAIPPLADIDSPAPDERSSVNWLNIFYAAEWAIFAGFAFYLWYRLARDQWEKEVEDLEDEAAEATEARG